MQKQLCNKHGFSGIGSFLAMIIDVLFYVALLLFFWDVAFLATRAEGRFDTTSAAAAPAAVATGQTLGSKQQAGTPRPREQAGVSHSPRVTQCVQTSQSTSDSGLSRGLSNGCVGCSENNSKGKGTGKESPHEGTSTLTPLNCGGR